MEDIKVVHRDEVTGEISIKIGNPPKTVTGVNKLVQIFVLTLLNVAGRDVLSPEEGGGLPLLIGQNFDPHDLTSITSDIVEAIDKTKTEVLEHQTGLLNEHPTEKLRDVDIISIDRGENIDEIFKLTVPTILELAPYHMHNISIKK